MNYEVILDNLTNIYCLIIDKNNNILYPKNKEKQEIIKNIYKNYSQTNNYSYYKHNYFKFNEKKFKINDEDYKIFYFENITNYINEIKKYEIDNLTTILNRSTVLKKLDEFLSTNKLPFSIVMADIDDFKKINDNNGHIVGDIVLNKIGIILNEKLKKCLVGRYGGEEFIIIIPNSNIDKSLNIVNDIKESICNLKINFQEKYIENISMSFGIYNTNKIIDNNIEEERKLLINCADQALYKSKNNGKNQITIY